MSLNLSNLTDQELVDQFLEAREYEKIAKKYKEDLRQEIIKRSERQESHELKRLKIPKEFFGEEESVFDFVANRYPAWEVIDIYEANGQINLQLRRLSRFLPWELEGSNDKISKQVVDAPVSFDWDHMERFDPELFERLSHKTEKYDINEEALKDFIEEDAENISRLEKYFITKEPTVRIV